MVRPSLPPEDEALKSNPLWQLHRRRMLEIDAALGDWRLEDFRKQSSADILKLLEEEAADEDEKKKPK